jgi:hypothetical protein
VECRCVIERRTTICEHALEFYRQPHATVDARPVYWKFDSSIMPKPTRIIKKPGSMKDPCHVNVYGISNEDLCTFFMFRDLSEFTFCSDNGARPLTSKDME